MNEDDISLLIKEAKPMYFARKRRRHQIATVSTMFLMLLLAVPSFMLETNEFVYDFDGMDEEINLTQSGSVIDEMGLPTDEYGLLRIS